MSSHSQRNGLAIICMDVRVMQLQLNVVFPCKCFSLILLLSSPTLVLSNLKQWEEAIITGWVWYQGTALKRVGLASMCGKTKAKFVCIGDVYSNMYSRNSHKMLLCFPAGRLKDNVLFIVVEWAESMYTRACLRRAISLPMKSLSTESNCCSMEIAQMPIVGKCKMNGGLWS